jgi:hypothetical protein
VAIGADRIIALGGGTMRLWDRATGRELAALVDAPHEPDDPLFPAGGGGPLFLLPNSVRLTGLYTGLSADGRLAVKLGGRGDQSLLRCWDGEAGHVFDRRLECPVGFLAVRPDGRQLAFTHVAQRAGGAGREINIKIYNSH